MSTKDLTKTPTQRPHVKWGSLVGSSVITLIAVTLLVLNLTRTLSGVLPIDIFIAYGPLVALFLLIISTTMFIEDFMPSLARYKEYKAKEKYVNAVKAAVRESIRSNQHKDNAVYQEFLKENPQYTA